MRLLLLLVAVPQVFGFSRPASNVLLLDHINLNHERGGHSLVKAFYLDCLGMSPDPRKLENWEQGRKTVWTNVTSPEVSQLE